MKKIKMIAIMGPSGAGKDSVAREVVKRNPDLELMYMYTTRPKRDTGDNAYEFISRATFAQMISLDLIVYYEEYNNWYYGYGLKEDTDKTQVVVATPSAVRHFSENPNIELTTYYLLVPEEERINRSLRREVNADRNEIARRAEADRKDFANPPAAIPLPNVTAEDFENAVQLILSELIK